MEGGHEDEEYDALNDETFGSAAVAVDGDDWEEGHEQMASLTEANRQNNKLQVRLLWSSFYLLFLLPRVHLIFHMNYHFFSHTSPWCSS